MCPEDSSGRGWHNQTSGGSWCSARPRTNPLVVGSEFPRVFEMSSGESPWGHSKGNGCCFPGNTDAINTRQMCSPLVAPAQTLQRELISCRGYKAWGPHSLPPEVSGLRKLLKVFHSCLCTPESLVAGTRKRDHASRVPGACHSV